MQIIPIPALQDNYIWTMINPAEKLAVIVDPGEAVPVLGYLQAHDLTLAGIFLTHHHWDHTNGVSDILTHTAVPVVASALSQVDAVTQRLQDGERMILNEHFPEFTAITVPGHTLDHTAYCVDTAVFSGDTLFGAGCGRLFEGTASQLYQSLQKFAALSDDTQVYCGHEYTLANLKFAHLVEPGNQAILQRMDKVKRLYEKALPSLPSSLAEEKETNPFLRCDSLEVIQQVEQHVQRKLPNPEEVFAALRGWKDTF
ncbi:MAG: hydroxyacylglutathione hydrolase [Gammaproteobacteria bacterium]|nr:hydroxyacylglutathione hydrolase [Gammaproteobacteria bacterium]